MIYRAACRPFVQKTAGGTAMAFGLETGPESVVNIKVIGVGGGGNNAVNRKIGRAHV